MFIVYPKMEFLWGLGHVPIDLTLLNSPLIISYKHITNHVIRKNGRKLMISLISFTLNCFCNFAIIF